MATKIEAENNELVLTNSNGDTIIIPKNQREEALGYLKANNHSAIDKMAGKLPQMEDYSKAENGSLIPKDPPIEKKKATGFFDVVNQTIEKFSAKDEEGKTIQKEGSDFKGELTSEGNFIDLGKDQFQKDGSTSILNKLGNTLRSTVGVLNKVGKSIPGMEPLGKAVADLTRDDYSDKESVEKAYIAAKKEGQTDFIYNGKSYLTTSNLSKEEQFAKYGITDDLATSNNAFRNRILRTIAPDETPYGYLSPDAEGENKYSMSQSNSQFGEYAPAINAARAFIGNTPTSEQEHAGTAVTQDLFNLQMGMPVVNPETTELGISKYRPTTSKDKNKNYINLKTFPVSYESAKGVYEDYLNRDPEEKYKGSRLKNFDLGDFTGYIGEDDQGKYLSYYDTWRNRPTGISKANPLNYLEQMGLADDQFQGVAKTVEVYDRRYFDADDTNKMTFREGDIYQEEEEILDESGGTLVNDGQGNLINSDGVIVGKADGILTEGKNS